MFRSLLIFAAAAGLLGAAACARDVNPDIIGDRYPAQVNLYFHTRGSFLEGDWYFMVFNFTAAPSIAADTAPLNEITDKDRGRNWEMYIAYTRPIGGQAQFYTLQRPNLPTVLVTKAGPVDALTADYNSDQINDIVVACRTDDIVQIILGRPTDIYNTTYFEGTSDIVVSAGRHPSLVLAGNVSGENPPDLLVFYDGEGPDTAFLRVIQSDGTGLFDPVGGDIPLGGTPVEALLLDFNADAALDVAVVTKDATGQGTLRILTGNASGGFTPGATYALGLNPVALASGQLDSGAGVDLAVGNRGAGATDSTVQIFHGAGDATFAPAAAALAVPGPCDGVAIGRYFGAMDDISVTYIGKYRLTPTSPELTGGLVGVYMNETGTPDSAPVIAPLGTNPAGVQPNYMLALDTGKEGNVDAVTLSGRPGSSGRLLYIQRGGRFKPAGSTESAFTWEGETISYITELEPSRIRLGDLNKDSVQDFLIPCPNGGSGDRICLYYGLGKSNYTSADIYWTDQQPQLLAAHNWLLSPPIVGPNSIELHIDPLLFYDLALQSPYVPDGFNVDFMTATAGIDLLSNPNHLGEVRDHLDTPINVRMTPGYLDDEQNSPRASQNVAPNASEDVDFWRVEVI